MRYRVEAYRETGTAGLKNTLMSTEQARLIAERIARRVSSESGLQANSAPMAGLKPEVSSELATMRAMLTELQKRLVQIESKVRSDQSETATVKTYGTTSPSGGDKRIPLTHSPWLAGVNASVAHASQEKFGVEEAVVSELVDFFEKEKTCSVEPGGKPCDHCAMCSSRGF